MIKKKNVIKFIKKYNTNRGDRWRVIMSDGHCGQIRKRNFISEEDAVSYAIAKYESVLSGKFNTHIVRKYTLNEYSMIWLSQKARIGLTGRTINRYKDIIRIYICRFLGEIYLHEITKTHIRNFIAEMQDRSVTSYNVNSAITIVKMILRQALEDDYIQATNVLTVRTPKHNAKNPEFWDYSEIKFFLNASIHSENYNLWKFVLHTGMRASEVAGLMWDCVHFDMRSGDHVGFITVKRTCEQKTKIISERTKNNERRMIPIFPQIRDMLIEMKLKAQGEFVFGGDKPIETSHLSRVLKQDLKQIPNLKRITFHGLRHSFCSFIDSTGLPRRIVAEIMGHRDLNTTNRYSHVSNQTLSNEVCNWLEKQSKQESSKVSLIAL